MAKPELSCRNWSGPFDLLFFDADRLGAAANLEVLMPKLTPACCCWRIM